MGLSLQTMPDATHSLQVLNINSPESDKQERSIMEKMSRRNLLKSGTLLGAGVVSAGLVATDIHAMTPERDHQAQPGSKVRTLGSGKNTIEVNYGLGLGCMGMSFNRSFIPDRDKSIALIRKAYDMGVNLFDTAEAYGAGANEELVGEAIAPFRNKITL